MKNYYFTFGQSHRTNNGYSMKDNWVMVKAVGYWEAREVFMRQFSGIYMPTPQTWSWQYDDTNFDPGWYPKGEFMHLTQKTSKDGKEMAHSM